MSALTFSELTLERIIGNAGRPSGGLADGDTTDNLRLALTGTGEPGQTVDVHDGDNLLGTATVAANGYWLFHTPWLNHGQSHTFRARYAADTDGASATDTHTITVDAPYPLAPATAKPGGNAVGTYKNLSAFAAIKQDGSVVTWGNTDWGGANNTGVDLTRGVVHVFSTAIAFAALKHDGSVVAWGSAKNGGDGAPVAEQLATGVVQVFGNAFAALKADGSVVTWGHADFGGINNTNADLTRIVAIADPRSRITRIGGRSLRNAQFKTALDAYIEQVDLFLGRMCKKAAQESLSISPVRAGFSQGITLLARPAD